MTATTPAHLAALPVPADAVNVGDWWEGSSEWVRNFEHAAEFDGACRITGIQFESGDVARLVNITQRSYVGHAEARAIAENILAAVQIAEELDAADNRRAGGAAVAELRQKNT